MERICGDEALDGGIDLGMGGAESLVGQAGGGDYIIQPVVAESGFCVV